MIYLLECIKVLTRALQQEKFGRAVKPSRRSAAVTFALKLTNLNKNIALTRKTFFTNFIPDKTQPKNFTDVIYRHSLIEIYFEKKIRTQTNWLKVELLP